jgi:hypothetical protein
MSRCPCCGKDRKLTHRHRLLGRICGQCEGTLAWSRVGGVLPRAYEEGRELHSRRSGSNAVG